MKLTKDNFFEQTIKLILLNKYHVLDIGGGLRVTKDRGNRYDKSREWILPYLVGSDYKILDPVPNYNPDLVGDIHDMPIDTQSIDAVICLAVLEHVRNPHKASEEIYRVLKYDGYCLLYVPFLYYYHAEVGYYHDYWRFTEDSIRLLFKDFREITIVPTYGATETLVKLSPLGKIKAFRLLARLLDRLLKKTNSKQTNGYYVFLIK